ncbi:alpha-L-rhamnosidase N-terminal domain-containing protein [Streptomyces sp. NBC_00063]|uniref:alpha-L-rhamnosidase N-terminal domain-containing protein n=1 Tax=Streptomyces sp. NBC_00063 TaxID=2975638 RepID=UPI003D75C348
MSRAPFHLRTDSGGDDVVVTGPAPRLSWALPRSWSGQDGYDLDIRVDGVARPVVSVEGPSHLCVPWPLSRLRSEQRVSWRVRAHRGEESSPWSGRHDFEAGLFAEDWLARWISPPDPSPATHLLAGGAHLHAPVATARLYTAALGVYEAFVNGSRAAAEPTPGRTSYAETLHAQAADVTHLLRHGDNHLEVLLSDGFCRGAAGIWRERDVRGTVAAARLELHVRYEDGTRAVFGTGEDWVARRGAVVAADVMGGQRTDFSLPEEPWAPVRVDAVQRAPVSQPPAVRGQDSVCISRQVAYTDFRETATFTCSDADLNRPHEDARWTLRSDAVDIGRTGDFQVFAPTAARLYDVHGFSRTWLRSVRDGRLGDAIVAVPWVL